MKTHTSEPREKDFKDLRHSPFFLPLFLSPWSAFSLAKIYLSFLSFHLLQITNWDLTTPNLVNCLKILESSLPRHCSEIKKMHILRTNREGDVTHKKTFFSQCVSKKKLWHKREPSHSDAELSIDHESEKQLTANVRNFLRRLLIKRVQILLGIINLQISKVHNFFRMVFKG